MANRIGPALCAFALASAATVWAQAPAGPPKPGPEHKQLEYFVGKWTFEGDMKASPLGPAGKVTGSEACEAFTGAFHVVCRSESKGPMGPMKGIGLLGYNAEEKMFTYFGIDSFGTGDVAKGTMQGADTWVYTSDSKMGGKPMKSRYTIRKAGADAYTFTWKLSVDGAPFTVVMEGRDARVKTST